MRSIDFLSLFRKHVIKARRLEINEYRRDEIRLTESIERSKDSIRIRERQVGRINVEIANGLKKYRNARGMTQGEFAKVFGYSVKAIHNYETGVRDIPSSLLEQIIRHGDIELHVLFGVSPDRTPEQQRKAEVELAFDLLKELTSQVPKWDVKTLRNSAIHLAVNWPQNVPISPNTISKLAEVEVNELKDWDAERYNFEEITRA